jgi:hypothetical protein
MNFVQPNVSHVFTKLLPYFLCLTTPYKNKVLSTPLCFVLLFMEQFGFMAHFHFWVCSRWDYLCFLIGWHFSKTLGILRFGLIQNVGRLIKIMSLPPNHNFFKLNTNLNLNLIMTMLEPLSFLRVLRAWFGCGNLLKLEHSYVRWKKIISYNTQWKMVDQIFVIGGMIR